MKLIDFRVKPWAVLPVVFLAMCMNACKVDGGPLDGGNGNGTENNPSEEQPSEDISSVTLEIKNGPEGNNPLFVAPGNNLELEYSGNNIKTVETGNLPEGWNAVVDGEACKITVSASAEAERDVKIYFKAKNEKGDEAVKELDFYNLVSFDDPDGTFVLNEGNMTTENGSLTYITPEGYVVDDAYKAVNGTELGNVCQDMAFCDGKIYIISQNGDENAVGTKFENDGMLVIVDAKTLKKERSFSREELKELYWPTHIAVLDESHVYIRDNKDNEGAIWRFDTKSGQLTFIEGSKGAPQTPFVVKGKKVYTYKNTNVLIKLWSVDATSDKITPANLPYHLKEVYQIKDAGNNNIWVLGDVTDRESPNWVIKTDLSNPSDNKAPYRKLHVLPSNRNSSGDYFTAHNNTIYYNEDTYIYSVTFDEEDSQPIQLVDLNGIDSNAKELYNGMKVNTSTGYLYVNTIKGVGPFYTTNSIWKFDVKGDWSAPVNKYDNYTNFPAGFFFAGNN